MKLPLGTHRCIIQQITTGKVNIQDGPTFTAVPFGYVFSEINSWINFGGGQELWDELAGSFDLKCLPCGNTGVQMGGWFRKEINSADDLKGLKMRIPGLGGDVMAKLGASPCLTSWRSNI